jgi:hypothetical protein
VRATVTCTLIVVFRSSVLFPRGGVQALEQWEIAHSDHGRLLEHALGALQHIATVHGGMPPPLIAVTRAGVDASCGGVAVLVEALRWASVFAEEFGSRRQVRNDAVVAGAGGGGGSGGGGGAAAAAAAVLLLLLLRLLLLLLGRCVTRVVVVVVRDSDRTVGVPALTENPAITITATTQRRNWLRSRCSRACTTWPPTRWRARSCACTARCSSGCCDRRQTRRMPPPRWTTRASRKSATTRGPS